MFWPLRFEADSICVSPAKIPLDLRHPHDHRVARIEGQVAKSPSPIESSQIVVKWMGDDAAAADALGDVEAGFQREQQEVLRMTPALKPLVDRELAEQGRGYRIGAVASLRLGQKCALDLRGAQGDIADDASGLGVVENVYARGAAELIGPSVAAKPSVERLSAAIELCAVVTLDEWARRPSRRQSLLP